MIFMYVYDKGSDFFRKKPLTMMILLLLTISPLNPFVQICFKLADNDYIKSRPAYVGPIFQFTNLERSPAVEALSSYWRILQDSHIICVTCLYTDICANIL